MSHVFISYSAKDFAYVRHLSEELRIQGFDVWLDDRIDYGSRWRRTVLDAIQECAAFVVVMTPDAERSEWVGQEVQVARTRRKPMFPLLLRGQVFTSLISTPHIDVSSGEMPSRRFYEGLTAYVLRRPRAGNLVTPLPDISTTAHRPEVSDDPPNQRDIRSTVEAAAIRQRAVSSEAKGGRFFLGVLGATVVIVLLVIALMITLGNPAQATATSTRWESVINASTLTARAQVMVSLTPQGTATQAATTGTSGPAGGAIASNAEWQPVIQHFGDVDMVLVPAGCFPMGSDSSDPDQRPLHLVCIEQPFWIGRTEITNAQYGSAGTFAGDLLPRDSVTWAEARAFCASHDGRLPTEAEWEYAARGPDGLLYPWGNTPVPDNAVYAQTSNRQSAPVGSRPGGASWVGALDMSGNVWEWVSSLYALYPYLAADGRENLQAEGTRAARGGSWIDFSYRTQTFYRTFYDPADHRANLGFRCARDI